MSTQTKHQLEQNALSWRKRPLEDKTSTDSPPKKARYYFRLESESSHTSVSSDTETIYSLQDKETDYVKDTSDTDEKSTTEEYEVEIEYDVASLSGDEYDGSSSSSEGMIMAAAAAAIYDGSYSSLEEAWITDGEDSDSSSLDESIGQTDYWTCIKCKSQNNNPRFRYCEKCFQDRKDLMPPRPRPHKKKVKEPPVKLDTLRSCLSGLSHDSGIGSSQECPPLDLDRIVVPKHLHSNLSESDDKSTSSLDTVIAVKKEVEELKAEENVETKDVEEGLEKITKVKKEETGATKVKQEETTTKVKEVEEIKMKEVSRTKLIEVNTMNCDVEITADQKYTITKIIEERASTSKKEREENRLLARKGEEENQPLRRKGKEENLPLTRKEEERQPLMCKGKEDNRPSTRKEEEGNQSFTRKEEEEEVNHPSTSKEETTRPIRNEEIEVKNNRPTTSKSEVVIRTRKRQLSESSISDFEVQKPTTKRQKKSIEMCKKYVNGLPLTTNSDLGMPKITGNDELDIHPASKEMCIICNSSAKDSIFLHGRIGHMSCCYKCAMRTWKTIKRCPVCNRKVNNVVKVYAM